MPTINEKEKYQRDRATAKQLQADAEARAHQILTDGVHDHVKVEQTSRDIASPRVVLARRKDDHTKWDTVK